MVLFCAFTAYLGLYFLTRSARLVPQHRSASFSSLSKLTFPGLARLFDFAVAVKCWGVSISYLIVIGGLMPKVRGLRCLSEPVDSADGLGSMNR